MGSDEQAPGNLQSSQNKKTDELTVCVSRLSVMCTYRVYKRVFLWQRVCSCSCVNQFECLCCRFPAAQGRAPS